MLPRFLLLVGRAILGWRLAAPARVNFLSPLCVDAICNVQCRARGRANLSILPARPVHQLSTAMPLREKASRLLGIGADNVDTV